MKMETEGERLKHIRKAHGLTLVQLGEKIGLKNNTLSELERGKHGVSEQTRLAVCREFGIRKEWLQFGNGPMRDEGSKFKELEDFFQDVKLEDGFKRQLVYVLARLKPEAWELLEEIAEGIVAESQERSEEPPPPDPEINSDEFFDLPEERQLEILRREKRKRAATRDRTSYIA